MTRVKCFNCNIIIIIRYIFHQNFEKIHIQTKDKLRTCLSAAASRSVKLSYGSKTLWFMLTNTSKDLFFRHFRGFSSLNVASFLRLGFLTIYSLNLLDLHLGIFLYRCFSVYACKKKYFCLNLFLQCF